MCLGIKSRNISHPIDFFIVRLDNSSDCFAEYLLVKVEPLEIRHGEVRVLEDFIVVF